MAPSWYSAVEKSLESAAACAKLLAAVSGVATVAHRARATREKRLRVYTGFQRAVHELSATETLLAAVAVSNPINTVLDRFRDNAEHRAAERE